ncbi:MAG: amidase [Chroococcidiopsidaceae cyanobacterium CP_BM_ER_R8_30]|nr:amidase [Chroococcidiopsidaceae cyanobacterium CP_BM_ER_R8_30]
MSRLVFVPAHQLAQMIRAREVSAVEVLDAYLTQIATHNAKVNAICMLDEDRARQRAKQADEALFKGEIWGPLHGVPITIKDCLETAELRTIAGYRPLANYVPQHDATAVQRLKQAGAIIFAKTNPAKLAGDYQTDNPVFGRTNNPWNLDYTTGGSSGGSAAAIAAGFSALELGSDIAGSIRQPAHVCGVYGLMPTDRLVPITGHIPPLPGVIGDIRHMLRVGPLARSVEDLRLSLSLIAGADPRAPEMPPVKLEPSVDKKLDQYRLAWCDQFGNYPVATEIKSALHRVIRTLEQAGCAVEQAAPHAFDFESALVAYGALASCQFFAAGLVDYYNAIKFTLTNGFYDRFQSSLKRLNPIIRGGFQTSFGRITDYSKALIERDRYILLMDQFLEQWDAWICPVAMTTAFTHCPTGKPIEIDGVKYPYFLANGVYTMTFNFTGNPVVVIPIGQTQAGLPIGMQIVGRRWQDLLVLAIAEKLNEVIGNFQHPSGY